MPTPRRPLAALLTILCLACPALALYPWNIQPDVTLLDLSLVTNWLHREGWGLHGPVQSVHARRFTCVFDPDSPDRFREYESDGGRLGGRDPVHAALEFDQEGRLMHLDRDEVMPRASQINELFDTSIRRLNPSYIKSFDLHWDASGSEVVVNGGPQGRVLRLSRDAGSRPGSVAYSSDGQLVFQEQRMDDAAGTVEIVRTAFEPMPIDPLSAFNERQTNSRDSILLDSSGRITRIEMQADRMVKEENETTHRSGLQPTYTIEFEYPDEQHVIARVTGPGQSWSQRITLNEHADVAEVEQFQGDKPEAHFTWDYEYDDHGNWTKRTAYALIERFGERTFEPQERVERTITYHDAKAPEPDHGAAPNAKPH